MVVFGRDAFEMHLRSTGCGSGDGQMVDFMRIIDEKMDL